MYGQMSRLQRTDLRFNCHRRSYNVPIDVDMNFDPNPIYNVPIDVDMNFDPNPILWTLENTLIPIRGHQTVPLL